MDTTAWYHDFVAPEPDPAIARRLAQAVRGSAPETERIRISEVAEHLGCRLVPLRGEFREEATLLVTSQSEGAQLQVRYGQILGKGGMHRLRFSIAHELGHTFFFKRTPHGAKRVRARSRAEERFCDEFAGELLCPKSAIPPQFGPNDCWRLSDHFGVTPSAVANQAIRAGRFPWHGIVGVAYRGKPQSEDKIAPRVVWAMAPRGTYLPRHYRFRDGPVVEALETANPVEGKYALKRSFGSFETGEYLVAASPGPGRTVIAAFRALAEPQERAAPR
ncbi:MAG: ImmA/IrrE family metallo-endopeptidase [bacterium]|nr:ImmA/IrrE family metallo-endopeptidase [bacterium]